MAFFAPSFFSAITGEKAATRPKINDLLKSRIAAPETLATKEKGRYFYRQV
jgi:hypothetical protein